ncbi:MAG TPA: thioredoxin family protein [Thermoplasmata archaeon]|nr:thioredoxin family protein [Thermoplasmata archaeon]
MAELSTFTLHPGSRAPPFSLPGVDGKVHSLPDFGSARFLLVVFWCNHCPYVQAWEGRMIEIGRRYAPKGVQVVLINPNDDEAYPDDRFERMVERAKEKAYPFPYLRDQSQQVAHSYGALVTPHPMLFGPDRRLLYQGRIDDNHRDPALVRSRDLELALDAAIEGRPIPRSELPVLGCSVKWKP